jgi:hypothetical protein
VIDVAHDIKVKLLFILIAGVLSALIILIQSWLKAAGFPSTDNDFFILFVFCVSAPFIILGIRNWIHDRRTPTQQKKETDEDVDDQSSEDQ